MNKTTIIVIGIVSAAIIAGGAIWLVSTNIAPISTPTPATTTPDTSMNDATTVPDNQAGTGEQTPAATTASVTIKDMGFEPAKITVKKGTTVTWTNQDSVNHNVVSDSNAPAGGPPATNDTFGKGKTYSFTFNTVGIFTYHCMPHPFMQGTVEVVE